MKLSSLLGMVRGRRSTAIGTACSVSIVLGIVYLVDCRFIAKNNAEGCYLTTGAIMGVGGGLATGYNTYNPALHKRDDSPKRDEHGRFTK